MKKYISIPIVSLFLFTACSGDAWQQDTSYLTEEKRQEIQTKLEAQLEAVEADPTNPEAYFKAAFEYQGLGQYKAAEEYYLKSLELDPNNFIIHNNLAAMYEEMEMYDLAIEHLTKMAALDPPNMTEVVSDGVRIYLKKGEPDNAQQILENYIKTLTPEEKTELQGFLSSTYDQIHTYRQKHAEPKQ